MNPRAVILAVALAVTLGGCVATNVSEPIEIGLNKYQVNHIGGDASDIAPAAQKFCRGKGFEYAQMTGTFNNYDLTGSHTVFFCMRKGDTIDYPAPAPTVAALPFPAPAPISPPQPAMRSEWCMPALDGMGSQVCSSY